MIIKSFISSDGHRIGDPRDDHADQARVFLASMNIVPKDYEDLYLQMFRLGFARVSEDSEQFHIERPGGLSGVQKSIAIEKLVTGKEVFINDRRYTESKERNGVSTIAEQILGL